MFRKNFVWLTCLALLMVLMPVAAQDGQPFSLTIMHTNDTHAAHKANSAGNGGVAIQRTVVNQIRAEAPNSLLLDAGDRFTGTLFHQQYRGQDQGLIMNLMGYDAQVLGNHEFDDGEEVLQAFLEALNFPTVTANVDLSAFPDLAALVVPHIVLEVGGEQIGIIGLVTPDTPISSSPSREVIFDADMVGAVARSVEALTEEGVNKIILLTHVGIYADFDILEQLDGVDVVVGGHSHTLLSNTYAAAEGSYPFVAQTAAGEPIVYVQAGGNNQYLGRLNVVFNADGVLTSWNGDTILLSRYIPADAEMADLVAELEAPLDELRATLIGAEAAVYLEGDRNICRVEECNLGSLIADAMRLETGADIAIFNGGGIRASIEEGTVTLGQVLTVLPFGNLASTFELSGADVIAALENGVSTIQVRDGFVQREGANGRFPQVSGIRFTFDPTQDAGSRIVSVEVLNADGEFVALDVDAMYFVVANDFMRSGGDGYSVFATNAVNPYDFGRPLDAVLGDYMASLGTVDIQPDGRIVLTGAELE